MSIYVRSWQYFSRVNFDILFYVMTMKFGFHAILMVQYTQKREIKNVKILKTQKSVMSQVKYSGILKIFT